jgi:chorismate synthase
LGDIEAEHIPEDPDELFKRTEESPLRCPDPQASKKMESLVMELREEGDSVGGIVEVCAFGVPAGLGEPVFEKLEA